MNLIKLILFCLIVVQSSCDLKPKLSEKYLNLTKNEYGHYKGISFFIRAYNDGNNPIIYLHDYSIGYNICGYKYFVTQGRSSLIVESGIRNFSDTCKIAISSIDSIMVRDFANMGIRRLMVDKAGNVFISTKSLDGFDMAKLVNYNDSNQKYKSWITLGQNWYQRP